MIVSAGYPGFGLLPEGTGATFVKKREIKRTKTFR